MTPEIQERVTPEQLQAFHDITRERARQQPTNELDHTHEPWTPEHDDAHLKGELWKAALFYTNTAVRPQSWVYARFHSDWPWEPQYFKPWKKDATGKYTTEIDPERCLIKAGALILAEQERLERALRKVVNKLAEIRTQAKPCS